MSVSVSVSERVRVCEHVYVRESMCECDCVHMCEHVYVRESMSECECVRVCVSMSM